MKALAAVAALFFSQVAMAGATLFVIGLPDGQTAVSVRDMPPGFVLCLWTYGSEIVNCLKKTGGEVEDSGGEVWALIVESKEFPLPGEPDDG